MDGHRCIHCNEVFPEHHASCVVIRYGEPGEDYHTDPPDHVVPPVLDGHAEALRERDEEIARLLTIIKGRTTPPTDAEIAAHDGPWLVVKDHASGYCTKVVYGDDALSLAAQQRAWAKIRAWVWHPFDERDGEMKAWPVAAEASK